MKAALISRAHLATVCLIGRGAATCRYVVSGGQGIECAKHDPDLRPTIDRAVQDPRFIARGDNCYGLTPVEQLTASRNDCLP